LTLGYDRLGHTRRILLIIDMSPGELMYHDEMWTNYVGPNAFLLACAECQPDVMGTMDVVVFPVSCRGINVLVNVNIQPVLGVCSYFRLPHSGPRTGLRRLVSPADGQTPW
jgi:hypothetical protein